MKNLRLVLPIMMIASAIFTSSCEKEDTTCYPGTIIKNDTIFVGDSAPNQVLEFDGTAQRIYYPSDDAQSMINGATDYTIEAWVKPLSEEINNKLILKRYYQYALTMYKDDLKKVYFTHYANDGTTTYINTIENVLTIGEWNHIAVINNSVTNEMKIYVNGVDVTLQHYDAIPLEAEPDLASATYDPNFYLAYASKVYSNIQLDEVRVIKEAVDPADLRLKMDDPNYKMNYNTSVLMHFDEGKGNFIVNEANNAEVFFEDGKQPTFVKL